MHRTDSPEGLVRVVLSGDHRAYDLPADPTEEWDPKGRTRYFLERCFGIALKDVPTEVEMVRWLMTPEHLAGAAAKAVAEATATLKAARTVPPLSAGGENLNKPAWGHMLRALHAVTVVFVAAAGAAVYNYTNTQVRRWSAWVAAFALAVCVIALHYKYNVDTVMGAGVENLDAWVISLVIMGISSLSLRFLDEQRGPTRQESRRRRRGGEKRGMTAEATASTSTSDAAVNVDPAFAEWYYHRSRTLHTCVLFLLVCQACHRSNPVAVVT